MQLLSLAALRVWAGVGLPALLAGLGFVVACWVLLTVFSHRERVLLGPADRVTLMRASLTCVSAALIVEQCTTSRALLAPIAVVTAVALALDAVDGVVARRTGTGSNFGARFDMETDAFLILVLSAGLATTVGVWVLLIGALRYLFFAASAVVPRLGLPLPPSRARKTVAALTGVSLLIAFALPVVAATPLAAIVLGALLWSFGRDTIWLLRRRSTPAPADLIRTR